jgi:hypothetical protein
MVITFDGSDGTDVPAAFVAVTVNVQESPPVRPGTVTGLVGDVG